MSGELSENEIKKIVEDFYSRLPTKKFNIRDILKYDEKQIKKILSTKLINGATLLHAACDFGNKEAIRYFLAYGADVNATDAMNETPLFHAKDSETLQQLILNGAEVFHENMFNMSVFDTAIMNNKPEVAIFFIEKGYISYDKIKKELGLPESLDGLRTLNAFRSYVFSCNQ